MGAAVRAGVGVGVGVSVGVGVAVATWHPTATHKTRMAPRNGRNDFLPAKVPPLLAGSSLPAEPA